MSLKPDSNFKPFITDIEIRFRIAQIAREIADDYSDRNLVIISVLKGAFMFTADLLRKLYDRGVRPETDFIRAYSYGRHTESSGDVRIELEPMVSIQDRNILLIDDIADSGQTLTFLVNHLKENRGAAEVRSCVLLDKPSRRIVEFAPDYVGFEIPNLFVIGYGIDYAERYRHLPFISVLESDLKTYGE